MYIPYNRVSTEIHQRGGRKMRNLALMWVLAACLLGCGGKGTQGKTAPVTVASEQADTEIDSVDVFSQTANVMVKVPYSELVVESGSIYGRLEVVGMANGAIAEYFLEETYPYGVEREYREPPPVGFEPLEAKLDKETWYVFFNVLYNSGIRKWKREYLSPNVGDVYSWSICIYTKDRDTLIYSLGIDAYPPDAEEWSAFRDIIDSFIKMMTEKKRKLREMKYSKRFGRPMSEYERSLKKIYYDCETTKSTSIELQASGEVVLFDSCFVRLNIEDWLDIINALDNISIKKNDVDTAEIKYPTCGRVTVYDFTAWINRMDKKPLDFPVSGEFKKIMDDIKAKITCEE
jgi:hypothetical protein